MTDDGNEIQKSLTQVNNEESEVPSQTLQLNNSLWRSTRAAIAIVGFLGFVSIYSLKVNMSVAMVCMVNQTALGTKNNQNTSKGPPECKATTSNATSKPTLDGEFVWSKTVQGHILGSFFYGYIVTQIPGGWLSFKLGGTRVLGWSMFVCAVATIFMPLGARLHWGVLMALRILAGLCQGAVWPAMHSVWTQWAPPLERSRLIGFTFAGSQIGNALTLPISGLLCEYGFDGGWPTIFYVLGTLCVLWFAFWMFLVYDSPAKHPRVSTEEKIYIESALSGQGGSQDKKVPWLSIFKSLPVWAIIISHTLSNFGTYTFLTNVPTYMKEVLGFDIKSNGALSALPYILFWVMISVSSCLADFFLSKNWMNITNVRKFFNTVGSLLFGGFIVALANVDCTQTPLAVALLTLGISFNGFSYGSGFIVNPADIAPKYSGVIFGLSNTFASIPGFLAPPIIGMLTENKLRSEWQTVFYLVAGIYVSGSIFFLIFASGNVQTWAEDEKDRNSIIQIEFDRFE